MINNEVISVIFIGGEVMKSNRGLWIIIFILSICLAFASGVIVGMIFSKDETTKQEVKVDVQTESEDKSKQDESNGDEDENHTDTESLNDSKDDVEQSVSGGLSVRNGKLVDKDGNPIMLRGISTHGLSWYPQYVNRDTFTFLRDSYGVNLIRLSMYTAEYNGYCTGDDTNRQNLEQLVSSGVDYATELGMYVIIDWHTLSDNNPLQNKELAKAFFSQMSSKYQSCDNVIYEICNEPNGTSWQDIKTYAEEVIPVIRQNDKDAVILVGTPNWCQYLNEAAADPLDDENVMYTLHFYAATHKDDLRNTLHTVLEQNLPVFVSEFGISEASGNGNIDIDSANTWISLLEDNQISYVLWNLSNKDEASAFLKPECQKTTGFTEDDLSDEGKWYVCVLK